MIELVRWLIFIKIVSQVVKRFKKTVIKNIVIKKIVTKKIAIIEEDCDLKNSCL